MLCPFLDRVVPRESYREDVRDPTEDTSYHQVSSWNVGVTGPKRKIEIVHNEEKQTVKN